MKISELESEIGFECLQAEYEDAVLSGGYTSDLLSDVMANAEEGSVLVTIQAHKNTVAVASLTGVAAIVFCNNRPVGEEVIDAASQEGIAVFLTGDSQFLATAAIARHLEQ
ncbi:MAG: hypothetical protein JXR25_05440 [Pontiellaceae bacterium]|nr:hypothetical protein [Pontiellaceae bacterium]MBN2784249.1 hypothetical protein [Pontiellaceae bacterium]